MANNFYIMAYLFREGSSTRAITFVCIDCGWVNWNLGELRAPVYVELRVGLDQMINRWLYAPVVSYEAKKCKSRGLIYLNVCASVDTCIEIWKIWKLEES